MVLRGLLTIVVRVDILSNQLSVINRCKGIRLKVKGVRLSPKVCS